MDIMKNNEVNNDPQSRKLVEAQILSTTTNRLLYLMNEQKALLGDHQKHRSTLHISLIAWNIALSQFYFGYCLIYLGSLPFDTVMKIFNIGVNQGVAQGIVNGCIPIGAFIGAVGSTFIIQRYSRRKNIFLTNALAFVTGIFIYIPNYYTLIISRLFQGICVGIFSSLAPMIIREFSPVTISGRLGTFAQLNITLGVVIGYLLTYILKKATGDLTCESFWYLCFGVPGIVIIIQTIMLIFVFPYDTPKYLLFKGDQAKAIQVLQVIYKSQYVQQVLQEKKHDLNQLTLKHSVGDSVVTETAQSPKGVSKLAIGMAIQVAVMQQFSGVNAINIYCGPILEHATSAEIAMLIPTLLALVKLSTTLFTSFIVTRFGRKTFLQIGMFFEAIGTLMIAIGFILQGEQQKQFQGLIICGLFLFISVFGLTIGPLTWIYIAETVEPNYIPLASGCNWIAASCVIILFPIMKQNFLGGNPAIAFLFFTSFSLVSVVICKIFLLETKDKTQREIRQEYLNYKIC